MVPFMLSLTFHGLLRPRVVLALLFVMRGFMIGNWIARVPALAEHLDVSRTELGTVLIAGAIGALLSFQLAAPYISRMGTARAIAIFGVGWLLMFPISVYTPNAAVFFAAFLVYGFCNGATDVSMNAQAVEIERRVGMPILSSMHGMFSVGGLLGTLVGGGLAALSVPIGPQFLTIAVVIVVAWMVLRRYLLPDERVEVPATPRRRRPLFSIGPRVLWPLGAIALVCGLVEESLADWGAIHLTDDLLTNPGTAAMGYTIFSLTMLVGRLSGDAVVKSIGAVHVLRGGALLGTVGLLLGVIVHTPWAFLAAFGLAGLGFSATLPIVYRAAGSTPGVDRATAVASVATACYAAFLLGPPIMGLIADVASLRFAFGLVALVTMSVYFLAPAVRPSSPPAFPAVSSSPVSHAQGTP